VVLDGFVRALDGFEAIIAGVPPDRWDAPSPCEGWSAVDVAGHVIGRLRAVEAFATGSQEAPEAAAPGSAAGDDPLAAWRSAREDMMAVLEPRALARRVPLPWGGQMPLGAFLERYPLEILVHTWDLARATGQDATMPKGLPAVAYDMIHGRFSDEQRQGVFKPAVAVGPDASPQDRLLAYTGRDPAS